MPQPPDSTMARITDIIELLHGRRTRIASLRLLSLNAHFFDDLAATTDLAPLAQIGCLFQCLMEIPYTCGFSKPVDRAITKLLLHAIKGCGNQLSQLKSQQAHDRLYWLPSESSIKEILDIYRSFLQYITCQHNPSLPVKDPNLAEAKRRLHKLCPRINNLSRISLSPSPTRPTAPTFWTDSPATRQRQNTGPLNGKTIKSPGCTPTVRRNTNPPAKVAPKPAWVASQTKTHAVALPTPPDTIPTAPICDRHLTIPTLPLTRDPNLRVSIPRRSQRKCIAKFRVMNGMVDEVTQPFSPKVDEMSESKDYAAKADAQLKREYAEWSEKQLRPLLRFSPEASGTSRCD
ncbi:hypothetical protein B0T14DRAFT_566872 [Immersiella caudata]|uniref:Uncharacterized protein n=1 Tax=Immersiella caudata TaxID=314043 RepID=A0AA40BZS9_9PEZI|nr:hypothetical protein B0T14DRAFT_566872 [Immersiella caudata]